MTSTLQLRRRLRRIVPVSVIVVGLLLISAVVIQQVAAQSTGKLKPPFKLTRPTNLAVPLSGVPPLPLNAPIVISETFDSNFQYNFNVNDTSKPWHLVNADGLALSGHTWGRVQGLPITDTLWNAGTYPTGGVPIAAGEPYTKNMQAYAIYGPLNMLDYASAFISVTYAMDTLDGDLFGVAYSTDGTEFTWLAAISGRDPSLSMRRTDYYPIPTSVRRQPQVWLALVFTSQDRDDIDALGVYVEDVVLRALPAYKVYLPIIRLDPTPTATATATPTATPQANYRYFFAFNSETGGNNPDFNRWGGDRSTSCGSNCSYKQALGTGLGNPGNALKLWLEGLNGKGGSAPRQNNASLITAKNFEYSADFYVYNGQLDARYGLVFDASSGAIPDSGNPPIDPNVNFYLLELHMNTSTRTQVAKWQIVQVENGSRHILVTGTNLVTAVNQRQWHNLKVRQENTTISFYFNGALAGTAAYDSAWGDARRRFGLYIDVRDTNGDNGPFEFFADNITVRDLP